MILPHSVNTAPLEAIRAYENSTNKAQKSLISAQERNAFWAEVSKAGINYQNLSQKLLDEGLIAFQKSLEDMLRAL